MDNLAQDAAADVWLVRSNPLTRIYVVWTLRLAVQLERGE